MTSGENHGYCPQMYETQPELRIPAGQTEEPLQKTIYQNLTFSITKPAYPCGFLPY
jgi:hypothetical protein